MSLRPRNFLVAIPFAAALVGGTPQASSAPESPWLPVRLDHGHEADVSASNVIRFGTKAVVRTQLVELEYIGVLEEKDATPHFILAGRDCIECDMSTSIYLHNPDDGDLLRIHPRHNYPGALSDYLNPKSVVEETRFFFGRCLPDRRPLAIWFVKWQLEDGKWKSGVFFAEKRGSKLEEHTFQDGGPSLAVVEAQVAAGSCREVPGKAGHTEP